MHTAEAPRMATATAAAEALAAHEQKSLLLCGAA